MLALRQSTSNSTTLQALQYLARITITVTEHGTRITEHRHSTEDRQHVLTCTEGTNACQSQVEEELLSFCKYYTMAVKKEQK